MNKKILIIGIILVLIMVQSKEVKKEAGELVQFRTSDLSYGSGSTIEFNIACDGGDLGKWQFTTGRGTSSQCPGTLLLENLPGTTHTYCIEPPKLYDDDGLYIVCCESMWSGSPFRYWDEYGTYLGAEPSTSTNPSMELKCSDEIYDYRYFTFVKGGYISYSSYFDTFIIDANSWIGG